MKPKTMKPKTMKPKTINISGEVYENLVTASKRSKISIKDLVELLITKNINYINNPVAIAKDLQQISMRKEGE